jgi:hypothetical protein
MHLKTILMLVVVLALASGAWAQTKISGTLLCGKEDALHELPVGDRPNHTFWISKGKCAWAKPIEIAGSAAKDEEYTTLGESNGDRESFRGMGVFIMDNGDKSFFRFSGSSTFNKGVWLGGEETWSFAGGTGKLKGLKGKGTVKGKPAGEGKSAWEIEGEYQLPK